MSYLTVLILTANGVGNLGNIKTSVPWKTSKKSIFLGRSHKKTRPNIRFTIVYLVKASIMLKTHLENLKSNPVLR